MMVSQGFKNNIPFFNFFSPGFRKEPDSFDKKKFKTKEDHFNNQVQFILCLLERHFSKIKTGLRELRFRG
jgi:hypothetical protein